MSSNDVNAYTAAAMQSLAGASVELNQTLLSVFTNILGRQVGLSATGDVTTGSSFSTLLSVFTYIVTPRSERPVSPFAYGSDGIQAALDAGQSAVDMQSPPLDDSLPDTPDTVLSLTSSHDTVDEGGQVSFVLSVSDLPESVSEAVYTITGDVGADDLVQPLSGTLRFEADNTATLALTLREDQLTEGPETLTLTLGGVAGAADIQTSVLVNDTSLTVVPDHINPEPTGNGFVVSSYELQQQFTSGYASDYNYTQDKRMDALLAGTMWGYGSGQGIELTYSFPGNGSLWGKGYGQGEPFNHFLDLNALQQEGVKAALAQWSEVANVHFTEVEETAGVVGDLRFAFSGEPTGSTSGWAYMPSIDNYSYLEQTMNSYTVSAESGDVWLNRSNYNDSDWLAGSDNYHTLAHEIGHSLGLEHPFETSGNGTLLTGSEDSFQYTIMSYTGHNSMGNIYTDDGNGRYSWTELVPSSPMLYDILAMQHLYGANVETRMGNDTYTFSPDTPFIKTIWDAGGTDTLDASNQTSGVSLDLNAGAYSSVGVRYMDYNSPSAAVDNLAIAFGAEIENAIGTAFDDILTGNALDNIFNGNGGSDQVKGGAGSDTFIFAGNYADYNVSGSSHTAQVVDGEDTVQLVGIEQLQFADQLYSLA